MSAEADSEPRGRPALLDRPASRPGAFMAPLLILAGLFAVLGGLGRWHTLIGRHTRGLTDHFFYDHDLPAAGLMLLLAGVLAAVPWPAFKALRAPGWRSVALLALAAALFAWAGTYLIYNGGYALSVDENLARFDARIFAEGRLGAPVPAEWRGQLKALAPNFVVHTPGEAFWYSNYLPVNAAFLAAAQRLGAQALLGPLWAGLSILLVWGIGRRLWPERPGAAVMAAALLATSPQVLLTAMSTYAMGAHLALNLAWLWLVLRGGRLGHGAAAGVAFLATGLHQILFHPLFAAPFVLEMWLARRWRVAAWHTAAYAAIGLFWLAWPSLHLAAFGEASAAAAASGRHGTVENVLGLLRSFDPYGWGMMAKNLLRFVTWQSLLAVPLALAAAWPALRAGGPLRAMTVGVGLMILAAWVLLPYQGHGWGYRYLHGVLGSVCLLAAFGWMRLTDPARGRRPRATPAAFAAAAVASALILLPIRAAQAQELTTLYGDAERRMLATDADVLLVGDLGIAFGLDLVRNDPFLRRRPVLVAASYLTVDQARALCDRPGTRTFRLDDPKAFGALYTGDGRLVGAARPLGPCGIGVNEVAIYGGED